jgi:hypothetical protein
MFGTSRQFSIMECCMNVKVAYTLAVSRNMSFHEARMRRFNVFFQDSEKQNHSPLAGDSPCALEEADKTPPI